MQRLKLYKSKKMWVVAGAGLIMLLSNGTVAHADDVVQNSNDTGVVQDKNTSENAPVIDKTSTNTISDNTSEQTVKASTDDNTVKVEGTDTKVTESNNSTTSNDAVQTAKDTSTKEVNNTEAKTSSAESNKENGVAIKTDSNALSIDTSPADTAKNSSVDTKDKQDKTDSDEKSLNNTIIKDNTITMTKPQPQYQLEGGSVKLYYPDTKTYAKGLTDVTIDGNTVTQYFNDDNTQVKGDYREVNGQFYYFDSNTGNSVTGVQTINNQLRGFSKQGHEAFKNFAIANNGDVYYFDEQGQHVTGLQHIDGDTYYFDSAGRMMKNYTAVIDGHLTTFDKATGKAMTATADGVKQGATVS